MPAITPNGQIATSSRSETAGSISALRLVVIEENKTKADLWRHCCASLLGFEVVGICHSGTEALTVVASRQPDLILIGLTPSDVSACDFVASLRHAAASAKLILLTSQCSEYLVHSLRNLDWNGLIYEPDETLSSLTRHIEKIRLGHRIVSSSIAHSLDQLKSKPDAFPKLLSARQMQVLVCIGYALTDEEIAQQLGFSPATAQSHRQNIMRILNIRSTPKLIRYCADKGFNTVHQLIPRSVSWPPAARKRVE
jgi:two-component system nitrate/nitrite response regulator NarL